MANQQTSLSPSLHGTLPAMASANNAERLDTVTHSSATAEAEGSKNSSRPDEKKKKKGKFKIFSLGRKAKATSDEKGITDNSAAEKQSTSKPPHSQSQSLPRMKDTTFSTENGTSTNRPIAIGTSENRTGFPHSDSSAVIEAVGAQRPTVREGNMQVTRVNDNETAHLTAMIAETAPQRSAQLQSARDVGGTSNASNGTDVTWQSLSKSTTFRSQNDSQSATNGTSSANQLPVRAVGMVNHGNSCFINAVVQCLRHTNALAQYFASGTYKVRSSQSKNGSSTANRSLELSDAFASLVSALWRADYVPEDSLRLKKLAGRLCEQYDSNSQQDAQEFLLWLLGTLDDELRSPVVHSQVQAQANSVASDVESSERRQKRVSTNLQLIATYRKNESEIWRHVAGFYESTLICPVCAKTSITYEPFTCLSLPLAQRNVYLVDVVFRQSLTHLVAAPGSVTLRYDVPVWQVRVACPINTVENLRCLKSYLLAQRVLRLRPDQLLLMVDIPSTLNKVKSLSDMTKLGDLEHTHFHAFVIESPPVDVNGVDHNANGNNTPNGYQNEERIAIVVLNVERYDTVKASESYVRQFARPFLLPDVSRTISYWQLFTMIVQMLLSSRERRCNTGARRVITQSLVQLYLGDCRVNAEMYAIQDETDKWLPLGSELNMPLLSEMTDRLIASTSDGVPHLKLVIEWDTAARIGFFNRFASPATFVQALSAEDEIQLGVYEDVSVSELLTTAGNGSNGTTKQIGQLGTASLTECLKLNFREELLGTDDAWMCPQCRLLQAGTTKKLSLCSLPELIIIHLKRFRHTDGKRVKIDCLVDFPLDGLDLSGFCSQRHPHARCSEADTLSLRERFSSFNGSTQGNGKDRKMNGHLNLLNGVHFDSDSDKDDGVFENENEQTNHFGGRQKNFRTRRAGDNVTYDLVAVVNHYGTLQSGHYTAYCRYPFKGVANDQVSRTNGSDRNGDLWFSYDDQTVTARRASEICTPAAYLLFYQRKGVDAHSDAGPHWSHLLPPRDASIKSALEDPDNRKNSNSETSVQRNGNEQQKPESDKTDSNSISAEGSMTGQRKSISTFPLVPAAMKVKNGSTGSNSALPNGLSSDNASKSNNHLNNAESGSTNGDRASCGSHADENRLEKKTVSAPAKEVSNQTVRSTGQKANSSSGSVARMVVGVSSQAAPPGSSIQNNTESPQSLRTCNANGVRNGSNDAVSTGSEPSATAYVNGNQRTNVAVVNVSRK